MRVPTTTSCAPSLALQLNPIIRLALLHEFVQVRSAFVQGRPPRLGQTCRLLLGLHLGQRGAGYRGVDDGDGVVFGWMGLVAVHFFDGDQIRARIVDDGLFRGLLLSFERER